MSLFIGLMSGTSADGMDAALISTAGSVSLIDALCIPYPKQLQAKLRQLALAASVDVNELITTERKLAKLSVEAVLQLLAKNKLSAQHITAIGSHGHTLRHQPQPNGFSWQINDPAWIAEHTGISCVADFRRRDIAAGGQGAPLVPAFHAHCFPQNSLVLNIGGIANLTVLATDDNAVMGFDTGPGNALIDEWCQLHFDCAYDKSGSLARHGQVIHPLLDQWLATAYFQQRPPKSTGRELFQLHLMGDLGAYAAVDVLTTLTELSARSISHAILNFAQNQTSLYVCGGGVHNQYLLERLQLLIPQVSVESTVACGINPDWLEAMAFAWLAECAIKGVSGNIASATGASGERILGAIYPA